LTPFIFEIVSCAAMVISAAQNKCVNQLVWQIYFLLKNGGRFYDRVKIGGKSIRSFSCHVVCSCPQMAA
jgi:hypothetical protein